MDLRPSEDWLRRRIAKETRCLPSILTHQPRSQPAMASRTPIYDALASLGPASVPRSLVIWDPPATPLSTMTSAFAAIATYLAVLYGGSTIMKGRQPFGSSLKFPFLVHNIALTIGSGLLLAVMLEEIIPILRHGGFFYGICHEAAWTSVSAGRQE